MESLFGKYFLVDGRTIDNFMMAYERFLEYKILKIKTTKSRRYRDKFNCLLICASVAFHIVA